MHAEVHDQRLVDAAGQDPAGVQRPGDEGQPRQQGEEHRSPHDAEASRGDETDLPLQPKGYVVDEGRGYRRIDGLGAHDDRVWRYFTL
ncbi:MAG: hypothetical protein ACHP85_02055 [Burkholderiales bacterium]